MTERQGPTDDGGRGRVVVFCYVWAGTVHNNRNGTTSEYVSKHLCNQLAAGEDI